MFPLSSNQTKICLDPVYVDHFLFDSYDKNAQKTGEVVWVAMSCNIYCPLKRKVFLILIKITEMHVGSYTLSKLNFGFSAFIFQNLGTGLENFSETSQTQFTSRLSKSLGLHEQGCVILHVLPVSIEHKN